MARECPDAGGGDIGSRPPKRSGCFKCGQDDHMARDCLNAAGGGAVC